KMMLGVYRSCPKYKTVYIIKYLRAAFLGKPLSFPPSRLWPRFFARWRSCPLPSRFLPSFFRSIPCSVPRRRRKRSFLVPINSRTARKRGSVTEGRSEAKEGEALDGF